MKQLRELIEKGHARLSIVQQCKLLNIHRSGYYYKPRTESVLNLELMRLMDEHYIDHPYKGAARMHIWLTMDMGYEVSRNRINRLYYEVMGLRSILPGPNTSKPGKGERHQIFPYLLRGLEINRANHVWAIDISYIPMKGGFLYLVAIIDIYSRFVVAWSISNTMTAQWCQETLADAIEKWNKPSILNSDQGSQFTSLVFVEYVKGEKIRFSMDGKGRCIDNVFIERLWWSVKYEDVYIKNYEDGWALEDGLETYFEKYNRNRRHSKIENQYPYDRYMSSIEVQKK